MIVAARHRLLGNYEQFLAGRSAEPAWLAVLRDRAMARFSAVGLPTTRDEEWRYTNVQPVADGEFELPPAGGPRPGREALESAGIGPAAATVVFVNGRFAPQLSSLERLPAGLVAGPLSAFLNHPEHREKIQRHLGRHADVQGCPFSALNMAFLEDGLYVNVRRNAVIEHPVHAVFVSTDGADAVRYMTHPRNLVLCAPFSRAAVVESYLGLGSEPSFSNAVTELVAAEESHIEHYVIERENERSINVQTLRSVQCQGADFASHSVLLGGLLVRNNVNPKLDGEGGQCLINGLYLGRGRQHLDNHMRVEHAQANCASRQFYKGILADESHGVFTGRIIVRPGAQKTDAKQTNANLLLSPQAKADAKPQLEIYADDVKCTHGATVGQVNEQAVFYLRSRGIGEEAARSLLLFAFANESLERMKVPGVRQYLGRLLVQQLPHGELVAGPAGA